MGNIQGKRGTKYPKSAIVEDSQCIRIDSAPLHCPVCLQVFRDIPEILPCGHSYCKLCIDRLSSTAHLLRNHGQLTFFECPLCRQNCPVNRNKVPNYAVDAILESIEIPNPENEAELVNDVIAGQGIQISRMKEKISSLENDVNRANLKVTQKNRELTLQRRLTFAFIILFTFTAGVKVIQMLVNLYYSFSTET